MIGADSRVGLRFIALGLLALLGGLCFGTIGAFQFVFPDFLAQLPFFKSRPLHVSLALSWIFLAAVGGIYHYLPNHCGLELYSRRAARLHFWLFLITGLAILGCYVTGRFGGREYWEFPAVLSLPIFLSWILFGVNYFRTVARKPGAWPVYFWMWGTGIVFFFLTFAETYLWIVPYFRETMVRELTVQWKAYGALVGAWNMLVYGTAIFVMEKISGDGKVATSKLAFGLYFLGLAGLLFGWSHHTYPIPNAAFVRNLGYIVSMTELLVLGKIIWDWSRTLSTYLKFRHRFAYLFLFASEVWVFLNLFLALAISIPAANLITHGTHVTVAHAMGSTIGINSMILLASVFFVIESEHRAGAGVQRGYSLALRSAFWLSNASLLVFWLALIAAGWGKGTYSGSSFQEMMALIRPHLLIAAFAGAGVAGGLCVVAGIGLRLLFPVAFPRRGRIAAFVMKNLSGT